MPEAMGGENVQDFDRIYSEYFSEVYKFMVQLCRDPSLAEEMTQEAFFKALKHIDEFKGECSLGSWLCQIAKHTFYSYARKQGKQTEFDFEQIVSEENIEERLVKKETAYEVHQILHGLREPYREVFWLRTFGELSFAQIAVLFGKTESWARVTYYRAKILIKEELK